MMVFIRGVRDIINEEFVFTESEMSDGLVKKSVFNLNNSFLVA